MKITVELYGASRDFSSESFIEINLINNSKIKDLRKELIKFIDNHHAGNENFHELVKAAAFCSDKNEIIHDDYVISKEQKIAIIPPIGGG